MGLVRVIGRRLSVLKDPVLLTLTMGHFTLDMYAGVLPVLYPLLRDEFELSYKTVGLVALAYTGVAALAQPLFGWFADRAGTRYLGLALMWTAGTFATLGFAPSFPILLVMAALAGFGSAAYHPFGALAASAAIPEGQRNTGMSVYISGGTLGVACGPLIGGLLFELFGREGTAAMVVPGAAIAGWILLQTRAARRAALAGGAVKTQSRHEPASIPLLPLAAAVGVMMMRAWTLFGVQAFIPIWYESLGYRPAFYSALATTIVLSGAAGNVGWGSMADRFGRRSVVIVTLILTIPAILLFAQFPGPPAFVFAALMGFLAASTGPLMLVTAQQLMRGRAGLASGLILGLAFVAGAVGAPVMGALADAFGMQAAMRSQALIAVLTIGVAWLLPSEERLEELSRPAHRLSPAPERVGAGS
jgi:FSR family fosmidomycin resistance protein-like MFS transporter